MTIVSHTICNKKIQWFVLLIIAFFNINVTIGQNCEVNFPGISAKTFSGSCGGVVDNLILGDNQYLGINDTFTFDSPLDISINGNLEINAEGSATIIIPAGVTVTVNGNIEFNAVNDGCDSGNPCTITFSVNGILNGKQNFENEISGLEWSGTGAVNIDGNFENTSDACMQCSPTTCPAFPTVGGNCEGSGSGCPDGDFCTNGNIGNPNPIDPSSPSMNTTYYSRDYGIGPPYSNDWDDANAWTLNPDGSGPAASIPQNNDHVVILPDHEIIINSNVDNGGPARSPNEIGSTKGSNNIGNNGPPNDNPAGFNDDVFYHEGSITVFEGGILTATVGMMIWNSNYISGTLSTSGDLINLGDLFFTETATFSTGDDLIISGNSFTRIDIPDVGNSSSNDDIYIDHTDAFICGLGVLGISNQFQLSNNATLDQVCSIFNITGCSPNPPGTCLSGNGSWPLESPILSGSGGAITFVENSVVAIAPTINVTYSDPFLSEATFIITSGLASLEDELLLPPTTGFSSSYNSSLGELKISGFGSFSEWESVMQSVTYKNLSENPTVTNRTVEFEISDGFNGSNQISIDIAVTAVNDPPVISTTAPATATEDVLYTYVAGVTDPDDANNGTDITWTLSNAPAGMTVSATGVVSWTPPEGASTSGTVTLVVEDGDEDASPPDTEDFVVAVTAVNDPPVISTTAPATATEDVLYTYAAGVTDPDDANNGTDITWTLSNAPAGMTVSATGVVSWTPPEGASTSGTVTLVVEDGDEDASPPDTEDFVVAVTAVNDPPVISTTAPATATEDVLYTYAAGVTDPDDANNGTDITWTLSNAPAGMTVSATGVVSWTPPEGASTSGTVTLVVEDGDEDASPPDTEDFVVAVTAVNDPPVISTTAPATATEDVLYTYVAGVTDPDDANNGTDITWTLSNAPAGMTVSATGVVSWTPPEGITTSGTVTLVVEDGDEDASPPDTEDFVVAVTAVNDPPVISTTAPATATEDVLYTYVAGVTDPDDANNGTDITWTLSNAPAGMTVSATGVVSWTPPEGASTSGTVTLGVEDGDEDASPPDTEDFVVAVTAVNDPPVISTTAPATATEDVLYTYAAGVTDPDDANNGTDITWTLSNAPAGMTVSATGVVSWTPPEGVTTSGTVTLVVEDGDEDASPPDTEDFVVAVTAVNDPPVISTTAPATATEDVLYTYVAGVTDPDDANNGTDITWTLSNAPAGMTVSATGVVSWTPPEGVTTSGTVTLVVEDGDEDASPPDTEDFVVAVTAVNDPPVISTTAPATATEDVLYTYAAGVTDPDDANNGTDITWTLSNAPAGMTVSATGVVSWTPPEGITTSGTVTLVVEDGDEDASPPDTEDFVVAVTAVNDPPVISTTAPATATEDVLYTYVAGVTDPDDANNGTDITWTLSNAPAGMTVSATGVVSWTLSNAPAGMTVSATGVVSWTPPEGITTSGTVTLVVEDGDEDASPPDTEDFVVAVTAVNDPPVISTTAPATATEDVLYTYVAGVTDPDDANNGTDITWTLSNAPAGMTVSATGVVSWTPPEGASTSGTVTLGVEDGDEDASPPDTEDFVVAVTAVNDPPVISTTAPATATEDVLYTYAAGVTDPDDANNGTDITWTLSNAPAGMTVSATGVVSWTPPEGVTTSGTVTLVVEDGDEDASPPDTEDFVVAVTAVNDPPVISTTAPATATEDVLYTYVAGVTDPDDANNGTDITWTLSNAPAGMTVSATGVVSWMPPEGITTSGTVTLVVEDGDEDASPPDTEDFVVAVTAVNDPPVISTTAPATATEDVLYTYAAGVTDPDDANNGTDITWTLSNAPAGMTVSATGVVSWMPPEGITTSGTVTLGVEDGDEDASPPDTEDFVVAVTAVNDPPVISTTAPATATEDVLYTYAAGVTDPDDANNGTDITWTLSNAPAGMTVSATGVVSWMPPEGITTSGTVTLGVEDGDEDASPPDTEDFVVAVTAVNDPPVISTTAPATATECVLYTYAAGVTDPDDANNGTDITWTLSNAPAGMTVSATGVVSWTPPEGITTSGTVTLGVEDGDEDASPPDTEDFVVEVTEVNEPPVISNCPSDIVVSTSGPGCNEIVNWPLPTASDNCSVDTFVSTHDPGDTFPVGATTVTYTATDSDGNSATCSFQVTVNDTSPPLFANCPEDIITYGVGAVTWISPSATDDCSDVNLSSNFNPGDVFPIGTTQVVYTAEDGSGNISTCSFFVTVANDEENPVITNCPPDVVISTTDSTCDNLVTWIPPTASDNDVLSAFTSTHEPGDIFPLGATTVTYTATDDNGNQSTCSFNVIVEDSYPPDFDFCPSSVSVSGFNIDAQLVEVNWEAPIASDNCTSLDLQSNYKPGDLFDPQSTTEVVYTATDGSGNVSECVFEVGPFENNAPSVQNQSIITSHSTPVKIIIDASDPDGDNLSLAEIVFNNAIAEVSEVDSMGISFIYKSLDSNLERDELSVVVKDDGIPFSSAIGTVQIQFLVEIKIEASQIFSPDGNNINDDFYIQNIEEYPENTVQIYDRWGGLIFEANGYDNQSVVWDGTGNNGRIVPNGTYYFLINPGDGVDKLTGAVEVVK
jgi:gliding motility-associated-like protein